MPWIVVISSFWFLLEIILWKKTFNNKKYVIKIIIKSFIIKIYLKGRKAEQNVFNWFAWYFIFNFDVNLKYIQLLSILKVINTFIH